MSDPALLQRKLERERAARRQAESILEEKSRELYRANTELESSTTAFWESSSRLRAIMDNAPEAIVTLSDAGIIEGYNRATETVFACDAIELTGQHFRILFETDPTQAGTGGEPASAREQLQADLGAAYEAMGRRADGTRFPLEYTLTEVSFSDNTGWIMFLRDITKRKQVEQEREAMEIELRQAQKMEALGTLSGGIAHEINTPVQYVGDNLRFLQDAFKDLATLIGKFEAMGAALEAGAGGTEALTAARAAAEEIDLEFLKEEVPASLGNGLEGVERISEIVHAIKMFSHPDQKEKTAVDLNEAVRTTATVARNHWKYVAELTCELEPELPPVMGLPGELNQVILNLIMNAAHAIEDAKRDAPGTIVIATRSTGAAVEFSVRDTGVGIPEENLGKIFEPFFTTKAPGRGTGQGMSILHTIVTKKHGGEVSLASKLGEGTTVTVSLPLQEAEAARMAS